MNLVDVLSVAPRTYDRLARRYADVLAFDVSELLKEPEPWAWDWKSPLRQQMEQLIGQPDVTAWTTDNAAVLALILREPTGAHEALLDGGVQQPPTPPEETVSDAAATASEPVTVASDSGEVSAEAAG